MSSTQPVDVALENRLMSNGIYVTAFDWLDDPAGDSRPNDGDGISLAYETVAEAPLVTSREVSAVVRTLLAIAEEREWSPGRLEATSLTTEGDVRGRWHVDREWFDALGTDLSEVEFSQHVLDTIQNTAVEE